MLRTIYALLILLCSCLVGCSALQLGGSVEVNETVAEPPNDLTVYVSVVESGEPVEHLTVDNFDVFENNVLLNEEEIGLRLLPRNSVASAFTVLLLDLGGSPSEAELKRIGRGAAHFVEKVSTTQPVTVVAFDGAERAREVARFSEVDAPTKRPVPDLSQFLSGDTSRDLNSAMLAAIQGLKSSLEQQKGRVHYGTVATLVRGPDLAGRKADQEVKRAMGDTPYEYYSLSPEDARIPNLNHIGRDGRFTYATVDTMPMRFQDLGMRVRAAWRSHYLLAYCSPARAGTRKLKVKVHYENEAGTKRSASTKTKFDATGFQAGCLKDLASKNAADAVAAEQDAPAAGASPSDDASETPKAKRRKKRSKSARAASEEASGNETAEEPVVSPPDTGKYE